MAKLKLTEEQFQETLTWLIEKGYPDKSINTIAKENNVSGRTLSFRVKEYEARFGGDLSNVLSKSQQFTAEQLPDTDLPIDELLNIRKKQFAQYTKAKTARKLINVKVNIDGPIAISHFGDPHVDDDGTDIGLIELHGHIIQRTTGMFGANIGDTTNNWVGRLARLYGEQGTTHKQAWMLGEWFLRSVDWLYVISGNHDAWSGAGDPIPYILRNSGAVSGSSQARIGLQFPNGKEIRINARHNFPGNSSFNPAHGPVKAAVGGWRDHVLICGHTHQTGYSVQRDPMGGLLSHCIRIASYKVHDRYAEELGLDDKSIGPNVVTILNPLAKTEAGLVHVLFDVQEGADYLTWLRKREGF